MRPPGSTCCLSTRCPTSRRTARSRLPRRPPIRWRSACAPKCGRPASAWSMCSRVRSTTSGTRTCRRPRWRPPPSPPPSSRPCATGSRTCTPATSRRSGWSAGARTRRCSSANSRREAADEDIDIHPRRARRPGRGAGQHAHPRRRPHADAVTRVPADRAAAGNGPVLAVPHRGGVSLRRARARLVLEQFFLRRAHRHPLRRADPLDLGPRPAGQRCGHDSRAALRGAGLRDRLHGAGQGQPRLPADRCGHRAVRGGARPHPARRLGADAHRLVQAARSPGLPELRRDRPAHAGTERRGGAIPDRAARRAGLRLGGHRHRRRPGLPPAPALSLPLLDARRGPLRAAVPGQPRPAAAHRRSADLPAAEDRARQRQSVARAGAGGGPRVMTMGAASPLPPHERTLAAMLRRQAASFGSRPLLRIGGAAWSHADAAEVAATRAAALAGAGVEFGDRVALMCSNRVEFLETFLGCAWLGAVTVPVNTAAMGPQIEYFLANSSARLLVIEATFLERLATADLSRTALQAIWIIGDAGQCDASSVGAVANRRYPPAGAAVAAAAVQPGDPIAILYTSGTTGPAKGVICPHAQYHWWGVNSARVLGVVADDVLATTLPLFHINALNTFAQAQTTGCRVAFEARFSASGFWRAMAAADATVIYLLGAMVPILLAQPANEAERTHRVRVGLGPGVPAAAGAAFRERTGVILLEGYGSTETNFVIATTAATAGRGVMGKVQPGFQARVVDEHDVELPSGEAGELVLRCDEPFAFASGYFGMPEQTVQAWRNLWFHTGDR